VVWNALHGSYGEDGQVQRLLQRLQVPFTGERYHLGGPYMTWYDFMHVVAKQLEVPGPIFKVPIWVLFLVSYPALWISYITKNKPLLTPSIVHLLNSANDDNIDTDEPAQDTLGYKNVAIEVMVADCITWMRAEKML
jgi:hypothetical protein